MPTIIIPNFGGEAPAITPRLLENHQAVTAINCQLERGCLEALRGPKYMAPLKSTARTIYKHPQDGWLEWDKKVDVVKSAVHDVNGEDPLGHLLITGDRAYPTQYVAGGQIRRLGIPRPDNAPEIALAAGAGTSSVRCYAFGSPDGIKYPERYGNEATLNEVEPDNVEIETYAEVTDDGQEELTTDIGLERSSSYCYTLVQALANGRIKQESAPSAPTEVIDVPDGDGVRVSGFTIPELPDLKITHIRIYRTVSGEQSSEFHFLAELELPVDSYVDTILDKDVSAEVLQTTTWDPIPEDATGLIVTNNGLYAAFRGNELLISVPNIPYDFPEEYRLTVEDRIVALAHTDNTIIVLTTGRPYLVSGAEPSQMQLTHLPIEQSCLSASSLGNVPGGVIYASPDGLMLFSANDQSLISGKTFTRWQWRDLQPANLLSAVLDDKYIAFFAGTNMGILFFLGSSEIVRIELPENMRVMALYHHSTDDCVYLSIDQDERHGVWQWEQGEELEFVWRSKPFFLSRLTAMSALRLEGEHSQRQKVEVNLYGGAGTTPLQSFLLGETRAKRIAFGKAEKCWSIELKGKTAIYEARLGTGLESLEYGG